MSTDLAPDKLPAKNNVAFTYNGVDFLFDDKRHIDLTAMWKAAGSPENKDPREWRRQAGKGFIDDLARSLNVGLTHIIKGERGKGGTTKAHWQVAVAYAKSLSHEFHRLVNQAFKEWTEERVDPSLKIDRAVESYKKAGFTDSWIAERIETIIQRKSFTSTLADHNCKRIGADNPFAEATRSISLQVLGKTPKEIKASKGLAKSARTRDHLTKHELTRLRFAESEAELLMESEGSDGNAECVDACRRAGQAVKMAIASLSARQKAG